MSTLKNIKDGFTNYMKAAKPDSIVDPEVEKVAQERAEICKECPELEQSGFFRMVNKSSFKWRRVQRCTACI
jgi:oligoribonuclease (3'-5' exoribonuclease)